MFFGEYSSHSETKSVSISFLNACSNPRRIPPMPANKSILLYLDILNPHNYFIIFEPKNFHTSLLFESKNHPISEVIIFLFTFQLLRNFVPLIKFDGNTEPVMVNIQGSDTNQMAEQKRFELLLGYKPTDGFQDRSLEPLGYCSILFQTI